MPVSEAREIAQRIAREMDVELVDVELVKEFWLGFVRKAGVTLHIRQISGENSHHIVEGAFKSVARSLRQAVAIDASLNGEIPSTKGVL